MRTRAHRLVTTLVVVASMSLLGACSGADSGKAGSYKTDAYKIGCPALDAAIGTGALGSAAAVAGLEHLRDQGGLSKETRKWLDTAVDALKTTNPNEMPSHAKAVLIDGCASNGYPLRNLTSG